MNGNLPGSIQQISQPARRRAMTAASNRLRRQNETEEQRAERMAKLLQFAEQATEKRNAWVAAVEKLCKGISEWNKCSPFQQMLIILLIENYKNCGLHLIGLDKNGERTAKRVNLQEWSTEMHGMFSQFHPLLFETVYITQTKHGYVPATVRYCVTELDTYPIDYTLDANGIKVHTAMTVTNNDAEFEQMTAGHYATDRSVWKDNVRRIFPNGKKVLSDCSDAERQVIEDALLNWWKKKRHIVFIDRFGNTRVKRVSLCAFSELMYELNPGLSPLVFHNCWKKKSSAFKKKVAKINPQCPKELLTYSPEYVYDQNGMKVKPQEGMVVTIPVSGNIQEVVTIPVSGNIQERPRKRRSHENSSDDEVSNVDIVEFDRRPMRKASGQARTKITQQDWKLTDDEQSDNDDSDGEFNNEKQRKMSPSELDAYHKEQGLEK